VRLDVWEYMTHEFHAYGALIPESAQALDQIRQAIDWATQGLSPADFPRLNQTEVNTLAVYPR
jgi:hypothetical protein